MHKGVVQALLPVSKDDGGVHAHGYELFVYYASLSKRLGEWEIPGIQRHQCTMIAFLS